ncbi:hypothetical protein GCM10010319_54990 [Streptomyces blastmyceticus]|uniref:Uncharacterized protein n=1 Tax=Streptomyces blastmyceticus TaxID=68180 RepID=A0ABP3HHA2_9ACTN
MAGSGARPASRGHPGRIGTRRGDRAPPTAMKRLTPPARAAHNTYPERES